MRSRFPIPTVLLLLAATSVQAQQATWRVIHDAHSSDLVFQLGPIDLPGSMPDMPDMPSMVQPPVQTVRVPVTGYLHGFTLEIVDSTGHQLPATLLHHINIISTQRRELFSQIMQRIGAAGAETGPIELPGRVGVPINAGDSLMLSVMFHNESEHAYNHVTLRVHMRYSGGGVLPTLAVQPFYMDVMPPAGIHAYDLPAGKSSKSWEGSPAIPGRVVALGGHLHKYGKVLRLEDVTAGKVLWEAQPVTDSTGEVIGMPRKFFLGRLGLQLVPSHVYRVTAEYDNPTGEAIPDGAMGALGGLFVPDERAVWPAVNRKDPEYLADVKVTTTRDNSGMMMMHH